MEWCDMTVKWGVIENVLIKFFTLRLSLSPPLWEADLVTCCCCRSSSCIFSSGMLLSNSQMHILCICIPSPLYMEFISLPLGVKTFLQSSLHYEGFVTGRYNTQISSSCGGISIWILCQHLHEMGCIPTETVYTGVLEVNTSTVCTFNMWCNVH